MIRKALTVFFLLGLVLSLALWAASYFNLVRATHRLNYPIVISGVMNENWQGGSLALIGGALKYGMGGFGYWPLSDGRVFQATLDSIGEKNLEAQPPRWISHGPRRLGTHWRFVYISGSVLILPLWIHTVFFFILPKIALVRIRRRLRRRKLVLCVKCGYDLRGSANRCPECNTPMDGL